MSFNEWWAEFVKVNMACINYRKDFEKCWNAAHDAGRADYKQQTLDDM